MAGTNTSERAQQLKALHEAPAILRVVNVWDAISAATVAALPETKAIATAGHSIAAAYGYAMTPSLGAARSWTPAQRWSSSREPSRAMSSSRWSRDSDSESCQ